MKFPPPAGTTCCQGSEDGWGHTSLIMDTWCCWFDNGHLSCWPPNPGHAEDSGEEVIRGPGVIRWPGEGGGLWRVCYWRGDCDYVDHNTNKYFDRTHCSHERVGRWLSLAGCNLHSASNILLYASSIYYFAITKSAIWNPFPDNLHQTKDEKLL